MRLSFPSASSDDYEGMSSVATNTGNPGPQPPNSASQPWYEANNEVPIGPARPKRMPAGRHFLVGTAASAVRAGGQSAGKPVVKPSGKPKPAAGKQLSATQTASTPVATASTAMTSEQPRSQPQSFGTPTEQQQPRTSQCTGTTTEQCRDQTLQEVPAERFGYDFGQK
ncbi:hypothetical protein N7G274_006860 [Stereocaulon virgatum]|uniref:Uncharacterized protein n=1 Tax=Stereocaulon virgatum TaxID=373712 RepID=A0ABR4A3B3_9LECA